MAKPKAAKPAKRKAIEETKPQSVKATEPKAPLPHEWLRDIMLGNPIEQWERRRNEDGTEEVVATLVYPDLKTRIEAAKIAAPYFAPRLASQTTASTIEANVATSQRTLSREELEAELKARGLPTKIFKDGND